MKSVPSESSSSANATPAAPQIQPGRGEELSAWLDGELDAAAGERLVAGLLQDPQQRSDYAAWCLAGDALRSQEVAAGHSPRLCARISAALRDEPALLAPRALPARLVPSPMARHVASGAAIAAAAAVVIMVALPQLRAGLVGAPTAQLQAAVGAAPGASAGSTAGATFVGGGARGQRLDPYFQAHHDFSSGGVMPAAEVYLRSGNEGNR